MEIVPSNMAHGSPIAEHKSIIERIKHAFFKGVGKDRCVRLMAAQRTDVGLKRQHNEDTVAYIIPKDQEILARKGALFVVADGMGGHAAGEVASEMAVSTITTLYYQDEDDASECLLRSIKYANALIFQKAMENVEHNGMGTTCVAAVLLGEIAYIANVGDSRAYLVRKGQVRQISQDHSWVAEQVRAGTMSEADARQHEMRNMITRSLGSLPEVEVDIFAEMVQEGDTLVLCSDGLSGMISDGEILAIVDHYSPQESVYRLIERANAYGGNDNITALVVRISFARES